MNSINEVYTVNSVNENYSTISKVEEIHTLQSKEVVNLTINYCGGYFISQNDIQNDCIVGIVNQDGMVERVLIEVVEPFENATLTIGKIPNQGGSSYSIINQSDVDVSMHLKGDDILITAIGKEPGGNLTVKISTLQGVTIHETKDKINKGINQFTIDTSIFSMGVYLISVEYNGVILKTDKFIITR